MNVTFNVTKVQILRLVHGPDKIHFTFEGPLPFPKVHESLPDLKLECERGYGEEYLKSLNLPAGIEVEVIDVMKMKGSDHFVNTEHSR